MKVKIWLKQKENHIWALGLSVVLCAAIGIFFDYYYDLNDDVLIKDILAGVYTGTPEGRNIQMLFPLSFVISLFYRVARGLPWYGIFLCLCHFGSIYLMTKRLLGFFEKRMGKVMALLLETAVILTLFLRELVFTQYTVTCTLLAATAAFLFYTAKEEKTVKDFFLHNMPCILLVTIAFQLRSEMLLLVLPLICVTGLCRWSCESPFFTKENAAKYFSVLGGIFAGLVLSQGLHMAAHGSADWREFNRYFDNRTELYDFYWQWRPSYEDNQAYYDSIGMTRYSRMLIENYNFGLDEEIDADVLQKISEKAAETRRQQLSFGAALKQAVIDYRYRTFHETDYPWNLFVIALYLMVLAAAVKNRHFRFLWELPCMGVVRSGLWLFILYRGRAPERITHSLYLMELCILGAMLLVHWQRICCRKVKNAWALALAAGFGLLALNTLPEGMEMVSARQKEREAVNGLYRELYDRLSSEENAGNFYLIDVYSSVAHDSVPYSEKMFVGVDNGLANYDLMGGWLVKSPSQKKKLEQFGISSIERGLLEQENIYVMAELEKGADGIAAYFQERGTGVRVELVDKIEDIIGVYRIKAEDR